MYDGDTPSASYSFKDAHIFLPAAGVRNYTDPYYAGSYGDYWSASLFENFYPYDARNCYFDSNNVNTSDGEFRYVGQSVRPVKRP